MTRVAYYFLGLLLIVSVHNSYGDIGGIQRFLQDQAAKAEKAKVTKGSIGKEASEVKATERKRMVVFRIDKNGDREYLDAAQLEKETRETLVSTAGKKTGDKDTLAALEIKMDKYAQTLENDAPESAAYAWFRVDYFDYYGWYRGSRYYVTWVPDYYFTPCYSYGYPYYRPYCY